MESISLSSSDFRMGASDYICPDQGDENAAWEGDSGEIPGIDDVGNLPGVERRLPKWEEGRAQVWVIGVSAPAVVTGIMDCISPGPPSHFNGSKRPDIS